MDLQTTLLLVGMVVLLGAFMFYSSYKNKKRKAQEMEMVSKLDVGDKIQTIGGIIGTITEVNRAEGTITVSTGTSTIVFNKQAVYAFGFFDKPKPAEEQKSQSAESAGAEKQPEYIDAPNADFIDPQSSAANKPKNAKKSKKTTDGSKPTFE